MGRVKSACDVFKKRLKGKQEREAKRMNRKRESEKEGKGGKREENPPRPYLLNYGGWWNNCHRGWRQR